METLFDKASDFDILTPAVVNAIKTGALVVRGDKIVQGKIPGIEVDNPWIFEPGEDKRHCRLWNQIYFQMYGMISRNCFNCWKVVVRPKDLEGLLRLRKVQKKLGLSGKCGMELRRESTFKGLYAGFWYCPLGKGLEVAQELHEKVEMEVKNALGFQTKVILKRACTEMEDQAGPSNQWKYPKVQDAVENYLDDLFELDNVARFQPDFVKIHILKEWIRHAWENRDESARAYYKDEPISFRFVPTVNYAKSQGSKELVQSAVLAEGTPQRPEFQGLQDYL